MHWAEPMIVDRLFQLGYRCAYPLARLWKGLARGTIGSAVAVWHGDELLLVWHSYRAGWSLPGGWMKRGESPVDCACRELAEEVGIIAAPADLRPVPAVARGQILFEYHPAERPAITVDNREIVRGAFVQPTQAGEIAADTRAYLGL